MASIVIIPVYKESLAGTEAASLSQCLKVLGKHTLCIIGPEGLDATAYREMFEQHHAPFRMEAFDGSFFRDVIGYNKLMLSKSFYERFAGYDYMLIYQLDAYVFRDELDYWTSKGYDYIGAPWLKSNLKLDEENSGNGGFSLRRTDSFIKLFSHKGNVFTFRGLVCYHRYRGPLHTFWYVLLGLFGKNNTIKSFTETNIQNEDLFYAVLRHKRKGSFNTPEVNEAIRFSFEQAPSYLFERNGRNLPFGCHGWPKYEYESFWTNYINQI